VGLRLQPIFKFNLPLFEVGFSLLGKISHQKFSYSILVVKKTKEKKLKLLNTPMNSQYERALQSVKFLRNLHIMDRV